MGAALSVRYKRPNDGLPGLPGSFPGSLDPQSRTRGGDMGNPMAQSPHSTCHYSWDRAPAAAAFHRVFQWVAGLNGLRGLPRLPGLGSSPRGPVAQTVPQRASAGQTLAHSVATAEVLLPTINTALQMTLVFRCKFVHRSHLQRLAFVLCD